MKKRLVIICIVIVSLLTVIGGYCAFNSFFPKAEQIKYPTVENIISVTVSDNGNNEAKISGIEPAEIVSGITNAQPTRKQSVNDNPTVSSYYKIEIRTNERLYCYFVYEEDGIYYIELPYEGVWRTDSDFYSTVLRLF